MREEIKAFEKTLRELGVELTYINKEYSYKNNKKVFTGYDIRFFYNNFYLLRKSKRAGYYELSGWEGIIYETNSYKDMIDFLIKRYKEFEQ